jgi:hypothetical protein
MFFLTPPRHISTLPKTVLTTMNRDFRDTPGKRTFSVLSCSASKLRTSLRVPVAPRRLVSQSESLAEFYVFSTSPSAPRRNASS